MHSEKIQNKNNRSDCPHIHTCEKMGMYGGKMLIFCSDCGKMLGPVNKETNKT